MSKIKNFYWRMFFSAYWLAFDMGEKKYPQWNAGGLLKLILAISLSSFVFIADFLNGENIPNGTLIIIIFFVFSYVFNDIIINSTKSGFKKQLKTYEYLSKPEMRKNRNRSVLLTITISFAFMIITMVINNPTVKTYLIKLL